MEQEKLIEAQKLAAVAFDAGAWLADRNDKRDKKNMTKPLAWNLGTLLARPASFWATAAAIDACGTDEMIEPLRLANQLASAQIAAGNLDFIRESLIGQAQWLSVLAMKLLSRAEEQTHSEHVAQSVKLALAAQRQAAQCLASAAALDKLGSANAVSVGE